MTNLQRIPHDQHIVYVSAVYFQCYKCGRVVMIYKNSIGNFFMKGSSCPHYLVRVIGDEVELTPISDAKYAFFDITDEGVSIRRGLPDYVNFFLSEYYNPEQRGVKVVDDFAKDFSVVKRYYDGEVGLDEMDEAHLRMLFKLFY